MYITVYAYNNRYTYLYIYMFIDHAYTHTYIYVIVYIYIYIYIHIYIMTGIYHGSSLFGHDSHEIFEDHLTRRGGRSPSDRQLC